MNYVAAAVQMTGALYESAVNLARSVEQLEAAAAAGAKLVVLPEMVVPGYGLDRARLEAIAETIEGPAVRAWSAAAARLDLHIVGGFCERAGDKLFNTAVLVGPGGLIGHYRKLHLFDQEKLVFSPGDRGLGVYETPLGRIGICVCYDLRFVEVVRSLALMGAQIVAVPTAWVGGFDRQHVDAMGFIGQARGAIVQANLSQVYLVCASQAGQHGTMKLLGSSLIADPYGELLAGPLNDREERIATGLIDPDVSLQAQARSPLVQPRLDRRTDVYGLAVDGKVL